ncbi:hypothetical protein [Actinomadura rubrisoli]|uniref:DUF732 domain-containing protein n=1 Tax=Actinomadura rubrisoli TaxID=2530368 RepID=A0A4R5AJT5_9ACTN|nr:hypothetical protein [Actinomadura rubrisoli]TDD70352.1 hypothetical protein E1298_36655 [Actinomadura rubrisoli]
MHGQPSERPSGHSRPGPAHGRPHRLRGWFIAATAAGALALLAVLAAALVPPDDNTPVPAATPSPTAPAPSRPTTSEAWTQVPAARRTAFIAYLRRLDPGLTPSSPGARPRPLRRAVSVCYDIFAGKPTATVLRNTALRYNGGQASVPPGSVKAQKIFTAARRWICSSPELRTHYDTTHP